MLMFTKVKRGQAWPLHALFGQIIHNSRINFSLVKCIKLRTFHFRSKVDITQNDAISLQQSQQV